MHRVQYFKITQIYLYHALNISEYGIGYMTVTEITVVHINIAHQKLDLTLCSFSRILWMLA
jgi:hypothetical protein